MEREQQDNATVWALALADLTNSVLTNYGNATGAAFDLTNMSNLAGMSRNSSSSKSTMTPNSNNSSVNNMTKATIVEEAAYQSAQYLANKSMLRLFNDMLKPLTLSANIVMGNNATTTGFSSNKNVASSLNDLEANLIQLRDAINNKAAPNEVMTIAQTGIHTLLMKIYGFTLAQEES